MFVRFAIDWRDRVCRQNLGVILGAEEWMFLFTDEEQAELRELIDWFNAYLRVPRRFSRSRRRYAAKTAICWFKESADRHIAKADSIGNYFIRHAFVVQKLTTRKPGYVVYEDRHQIAAVPFRDTFEC